MSWSCLSLSGSLSGSSRALLKNAIDQYSSKSDRSGERCIARPEKSRRLRINDGGNRNSPYALVTSRPMSSVTLS